MDYVYIGKIVNTHGIKSELRLKSNFDKKDKVFKPGIKIYIGDTKQEEEIESYRPHKDFDMILLKGYNNINQVLKYLKENVYVTRDILELKKEEYILEDLLNKEIYEGEEKLGKVIDIVYNGSNKLLLVMGEKKIYIPICDYYIKKVILKDNIIYVENAKELIL